MIVLSFLAAIIIIYGQKTRLYNSIMKVYIYRDNITDSRRMTAITVTLEERLPPLVEGRSRVRERKYNKFSRSSSIYVKLMIGSSYTLLLLTNLLDE